MENSKDKLRKEILEKRKQLNSADLSVAANNIAVQAKSNAALSSHFNQANQILSYVAFKGEVPTEQLLDNSKAAIYLPKITNYKQSLMRFYPASQPLQENRYGITEPVGNVTAANINDFDIVLAPLVAFDQAGNRLGMGAGFYDRALQPLNGLSDRPLLIGLAHPFQEVKSISPDSWDYPLDVILTGEKIIDRNKSL